ncbi:MAG: TIGR04255 family protein [Oscillospiraceae bacterium]
MGLRYLNIVSRNALGLEDTPWRELFTPPYLGVLAERMWTEHVPVAGLDVQLKLNSSSAARFTPVPPILKNNTPNAPQDPEVKFILDMDLSMSGNTPCGLAAPALETLHGHSTRIFEGAVTDTLRQAMGRV